MSKPQIATEYIIELLKEVNRLRELMQRLVENAEFGDEGEMIVDVDDFNAIEGEAGYERR